MQQFDWLNPPAGEYTHEEYLTMFTYWMQSTSCTRNKLSVKAGPFSRKFFGNKRLHVKEYTVVLEDLHENSN